MPSGQVKALDCQQVEPVRMAVCSAGLPPCSAHCRFKLGMSEKNASLIPRNITQTPAVLSMAPLYRWPLSSPHTLDSPFPPPRSPPALWGLDARTAYFLPAANHCHPLFWKLYLNLSHSAAVTDGGWCLVGLGARGPFHPLLQTSSKADSCQRPAWHPLECSLLCSSHKILGHLTSSSTACWYFSDSLKLTFPARL